MKRSIKTYLMPVICVTLAALCGVLAGCGVNYEEVYNDNSKIISYNGNYTAMGRVRNVHSDSSYVSCFSFSGVDTLYTRFDVDGETSANLTVNYTGEEGKLKLVLTDGDNVYILKEVGFLDGGAFIDGYSGEVDFGNILDGRYKLKLVGYKAEFNLQLNF